MFNRKFSLFVSAIVLFFGELCCAEPHKIDSEIMTDSMIRQHLSIIDPNEFDPGHYKTFLWIQPCPAKPFYVKTYRPMLDMERQNKPFLEHAVDDLEEKMLYKDGKALIAFFSSKGFLMGEEIIVSVYDKDSNKIAEKKIIPFPLVKLSPVDRAEISLKLNLISPSMYEVRFCGFPKDECLKMKSESNGEIIPDIILPKLEEGFINYSPDVLDCKGGTAKLTFTRKSGEKIIFRIPWGDCLIPYFNGLVLAPKTVHFCSSL